MSNYRSCSRNLQEGQTIISAEARLGLQREIANLERDIQRTAQDSQAEAERISQDAEAEVQALQQQLQIEFQQKLVPIIEQVAEDKGLSFIFKRRRRWINLGKYESRSYTRINRAVECSDWWDPVGFLPFNICLIFLI